MTKNKKGFANVGLFTAVFFFFLIIGALGLIIILFSWINFALDRDVQVGQVNLQDINNQTFGQLNLAVQTRMDDVGIMIILGMSLLMIFNAYYFASDNPKVFFVLDIVLLIFAFITAIYVAQVYDTFINSTPYVDAYINELPNSSDFILNLPLLILAIGLFVMFVSYAGFKKREIETNVRGF